MKNCPELGRVNIGWTIGEELLFDQGEQAKKSGRSEFCFAESESCLLGINKGKLSILQKELLNEGNHKDFYVIESVLKGNYLIKRNWRKGEL